MILGLESVAMWRVEGTSGCSLSCDVTQSSMVCLSGSK